jgi:hypothetical protein
MKGMKSQEALGNLFKARLSKEQKEYSRLLQQLNAFKKTLRGKGSKLSDKDFYQLGILDEQLLKLKNQIFFENLSEFIKNETSYTAPTKFVLIKPFLTVIILPFKVISYDAVIKYNYFHCCVLQVEYVCDANEFVFL